MTKMIVDSSDIDENDDDYDNHNAMSSQSSAKHVKEEQKNSQMVTRAFCL